MVGLNLKRCIGIWLTAVCVAMMALVVVQSAIAAAAAEPAKKAKAVEPAPATQPVVVPPKIAPVALSKAHQAMCKVQVGQPMPEISLPPLAGGEAVKLSSLYGKKGTVVVFWKGDRRMGREELADVGPEVLDMFGKAGIAVVGIATGSAANDAAAALKAAKAADFPNLSDADGKAFALVGTEKLPRTFLLDPQGKILWFDIEYSLATRRELNEALRAVAGEPKPSK
jgi:peroxiredoxin